MKSVVISTYGLFNSPRSLDHMSPHGLNQQTLFADLPLQARLLLAVSRVRGVQPKVPIAERYVLDTLGRIIDAGSDRQNTIDAINLLTEVLLVARQHAEPHDAVGSEWLSSAENLVLCVLCKVRSGRTAEAAKLAKYLLTDTSFDQFDQAASTLCNAECFKRAGPHVFTPSWSTSTSIDTQTKHCSVTRAQQLSLIELLLLNTLRLRIRTLRYSNIGSRVVPMLRESLALPRIESLIDAHLVEALQYSETSPDIRCLCCSDISADEAKFLDVFAHYTTTDDRLISEQLSGWLPNVSASRLKVRTQEFQSIVMNLGESIPLRNWDFVELKNRTKYFRQCDHFSEAAIAH